MTEGQKVIIEHEGVRHVATVENVTPRGDFGCGG
jgi:hypothetical protein